MAKSQISDALLISMYVSGDESALATLIDRHQSRIYGFIYSKVNNRDVADDFFQEVFIKVIKTLKTNGYYDEKGKFLAWVLRIANNMIVDDYRKKKKHLFLRDTDEYSIFSIIKDEAHSVERKMVIGEIEVDLKKIIDNLPDDQKEVVILRFFEDKSFKEISDEVGVSLNTALGRMRYAIANIRKQVEKNKISLIS